MQKIYGALALSMVMSALSSAATVLVNPITALSARTTAWESKYRLAHSGYDMSLGNSALVTADLGNRAFLDNRTFRMTVQNIVGQGLVLSMTDLTLGTTKKVGWGTFTPTIAGSAATLNGLSAFSKSYNALKISAIGKSGNAPRLDYSNFIVGGSATIGSGTFRNSFVSKTSGDAGTPGEMTQWVASAVNLANVNYTLSADIKGFKGNNGGDDQVTFSIAGVTTNPVPEPSTVALLCIGLAGLIRRRRKS